MSNLRKTRTAKKVKKGKHTIQILPKRLSGIQKVAEETWKPILELMHTRGFHSHWGLAMEISQQEMYLISLGKNTCLNPFLCAKMLKPLLPQFSCPNPHIPGISLWNFLVPVRIFGASFQTILSDHQSPIYIIKSTMIETVFKLDCFLWGQLGFFS